MSSENKPPVIPIEAEPVKPDSIGLQEKIDSIKRKQGRKSKQDKEDIEELEREQDKQDELKAIGMHVKDAEQVLFVLEPFLDSFADKVDPFLPAAGYKEGTTLKLSKPERDRFIQGSALVISKMPHSDFLEKWLPLIMGFALVASVTVPRVMMAVAVSKLTTVEVEIPVEEDEDTPDK